MWSKCISCGSKFETGVGGPKRKNATGRKRRTCSDKCAAIMQAIYLKKRTICAVCGGPKASRYALTCSKKCRHDKQVASLTGKMYNLCHYVAPDEWDYANMLDILHRKGYVKSKDTKEKWTYTTKGYPEIKWVDRVASGVVVSGETGSGEEQQGHEDGVQQQA